MRVGFVRNDGLDLVLTIVVYTALLAVTLLIREAARARVANATGDPIPRLAGRMTPGREAFDPLGSGLFPLLAAALPAVAYSWAKPVNYDLANPGPPRRVIPGAVAGSLANLATAFLAAQVLSPMTVSDTAGRVLGLFVTANVTMAVMHLLPIPPLDGARILSSLLTPQARTRLIRFEPYGIAVLFGLAFLGRYWNSWPYAQIINSLRRLVA